MILDQLVEKKDIYKYIGARIRYLWGLQKQEKIRKFPKEDRQKLIYGYKKRIKELEFLKKILHQDSTRKISFYARKFWIESGGKEKE